MKVAAVVVTYNRRELLEQTLAGLEQQSRPVDKIFVIDNASTDETEAYLASRAFTVEHRVVRLPENTGGAGGFSEGTRLAYEEGFDGVWLMDDDTIPREGALAPLVTTLGDAEERLGFRPSFACSMVLWKDGSMCEMNTPEPTWDWIRPLALGADYTLMKSCSFVSVLVTRQAIHAVGLPSANFFIWYDDAEYTQRLSKYRPGVFVPASKVDHLLPQNRGVNFGDVNDQNVWKFEYGVRNQIASAIRFRNPALAVDLVERVYAQTRGSGVSRANKVRLLKAAARGLRFRPEIKHARSVR
ncbi:glycosyltransferase family 2 protein [Arsenicicoccus bolidensis]|uniref:Glycosyltransferase family 2 protein n=1 Tax=Arsenicicoccus bolidensis TaxID=229480 RepID=A0ABS9Q2E8_9MICO|nr:glycosyltransferase family 2 protein [Arsenicicoccus bolidensis]MCG7322050.1 glycosyltransferase family 2 protein [Arsenicicoccus bolidensis]